MPDLLRLGLKDMLEFSTRMMLATEDMKMLYVVTNGSKEGNERELLVAVDSKFIAHRQDALQVR